MKPLPASKFAQAMNPTFINRRTFLNQATVGIGSTALSSMLADNAMANPQAWPANLPPHAKLSGNPKAKRVIFLCMAGGPSHLETFDYKPKLKEMDGKPMPESITKGQPVAQLQGKQLKCFAPQLEFKKWGKSGQYFSSAFPKIGGIADDICIVRSMTTEQINQDPAHTNMNTGKQISGRPSMGSWVLYGLGAETNNLPGFVVLTSVGGGQNQPNASRQWNSGFLPSKYQGVHFHSKGDPVLYLSNPNGVTNQDQRSVIDSVNQLNRIGNLTLRDPEISTKISQYEMAFRMQASVPDLMDVSNEPKHVLDMYGAKPGDGSFASNCLLARRLAERDVRFIHLYHRGWDHHGGVKTNVPKTANLVDQGSAALVQDLKQRGMLEDTLVVWGGEFGRTPMSQGSGKGYGRDHHPHGFSMWMAGGGIRAGHVHGSTDDFGYFALEDRVHVHDINATILHCLGINHESLTFHHQGRDFKLTDEFGKVVDNIII